MNYLTEINGFYKWLEEYDLSTSCIALWHALMYCNNRARWSPEFTVAMSVLEQRSGLSNKSVKRCRNTLSELGLIEWKSRSGSQSAVYKMISFAGHGDPQKEDAEHAVAGHGDPQIEKAGHDDPQNPNLRVTVSPIIKQDLKTTKPKQKNRGDEKEIDNTNNYSSFYALFPNMRR